MSKIIARASTGWLPMQDISLKATHKNTPRSTSMPAALAAPYGVVAVEYTELEQSITVMYHGDIKDAQDENP